MKVQNNVKTSYSNRKRNMQLMKKILKLMISLSFLIILTGCWNYREVNQDFIVTAAAIDKAATDT